MKLGKLSNDKLDSLILSKFGHMRKEVVCSPHVGVDCAAVDLGGRIAVLSTDPITAADKNIGSLTVHVSCNDAAAAGAEPIGLLVTLLIPPHGTEEEVEHIAQELSEAAKLANIEIIGGHTEVTASVTRYVTCAAVIARAGKNGIITPAGMKAGQDIIMTKMAGIEGTAVIASDAAGRTGLTDAELEEARGFMSMVSVVKEGLYAAEHGATAMHDITEGVGDGRGFRLRHGAVSRKGDYASNNQKNMPEVRHRPLQADIQRQHAYCLRRRRRHGKGPCRHRHTCRGYRQGGRVWREHR